MNDPQQHLREGKVTIHAVLLIPDPEHVGLLDDGVCGSRPPMAWRSDTDHCEECGLPLADGDCPSPPGSRPPGSDAKLGCWEARGNDNDGVWHPGWMEDRDASEVYALVLAWEGGLVPEGLDRLDHVKNAGRRATPGRWSASHSCTPALDMGRLWVAWEQGWIAEREGLGTIVLLDEDLREVLP